MKRIIIILLTFFSGSLGIFQLIAASDTITIKLPKDATIDSYGFNKAVTHVRGASEKYFYDYKVDKKPLQKKIVKARTLKIPLHGYREIHINYDVGSSSCSWGRPVEPGKTYVLKPFSLPANWGSSQKTNLFTPKKPKVVKPKPVIPKKITVNLPKGSVISPWINSKDIGLRGKNALTWSTDEHGSKVQGASDYLIDGKKVIKRTNTIKATQLIIPVKKGYPYLHIVFKDSKGYIRKWIKKLTASTTYKIKTKECIDQVAREIGEYTLTLMFIHMFTGQKKDDEAKKTIKFFESRIKKLEKLPHSMK